MSKLENYDAHRALELLTDGVMERGYRILLLPSNAERIQLADLAGHQSLTEKQRKRIRDLLDDKEHALIISRK
ncbi:hypothetical protein CEXT_110381 [Caerostris extrusa]|uniref:Uncharacterized protein n=1 Tax=Caerostris extrusa TaxID=172846 RepID=A0AAV4SVR9_CAEEX|nr:hypothetical protein CEXT_110381 [Caerostris extrusa]